MFDRLQDEGVFIGITLSFAHLVGGGHGAPSYKTMSSGQVSAEYNTFVSTCQMCDSRVDNQRPYLNLSLNPVNVESTNCQRTYVGPIGYS